MKTFHHILVTAICLAVGVVPAATAGPTVQALLPAPGVLSNLTSVAVTFSAAVNGPAAEDLLINGNPATSVSGSGDLWTFAFSQPAPGPVQCSWDGSHGIYDLAGNRFDELAAGATWSYTLVDTVAPTVKAALPTPGAEVGALTEIELTFSEPVTGVSAADLLVNGQVTLAVTGTGAGPYRFSFAQPAGGPVAVSWAGGHGISDTAPVPNPFAGGGWSYTLTPGLVTDVVLNEIMADNLSGLRDEDQDTSDWIELFNRGSASVNLLGWALTDDPLRPGQWVFPAVILNPGEYLVVFASGKDRATTGPGTNHANFTLAGSGYLGLYNAQLPRQMASEFAPVYPEQRGDIAWGPTGSGSTAYFATATPGAPNSSPTNYLGFAERPHASIASGLFGVAFQVALSSPTPGAAIYYTLNGEVPTPVNGSLYSELIPIAGTPGKPVVPLRAAAYKAGLLPSTVLTRSYVFPDYVVQQPAAPPGFPTNWITGRGMVTTSGDYEMDPQVLTNNNNLQIARQALAQLPVVSLVAGINTFFAPTSGVYTARLKQGNQRAVNAEMWLPTGERVFQADCGFEIQGGSSPSDSGSDWKDKKLSLRLIFRGDFGTPKLQAKIFPDTPVEEFDTLILDAGLNFWWTHMTDGDQRNRAKFITDQYTSDLMNNAGMVAQHGRHVHLYLNGLYWGLYDLHERMDEAAAASYLGGQKEEWDVLKHTGDAAGLQNGTLTNYNAMFAVARSGLANNAVYEQLQNFLDVPWLADYLIVNFWTGNTDWPVHNWYAWRRSRTPGSLPWRFVSWDAEHTIKNYAENRLAISDANSPGELFQLLRNNTEFRVLFGDRVHKLMFNGGPLYSIPDKLALWTPATAANNVPATVYRKRVDEIWDSVVCESARWGDVATPTAPYTRELHYTRELNALFTLTNLSGQTPNYFPLRGSNVMAQFRAAGLYPAIAAPAFSQHGGRVAPGYLLTITNVNGAGTVYYTTNGTDPRAYGSGAVAPGVLPYLGIPLSIDRPMTVKARTLVGVAWSALNEAGFTAGALGLPLRLTEIMYNPTPGPAPGNAYEFLELLNAGPNDLDLGGYYFEGVSYSFPPSFRLAAGARVVLASDVSPAAFAVRYPGVPVAGYFGGALNNAGERLAIKDPAGNFVLTVDYDDANGWPAKAATGGCSLEMIDLNGNPDDPANWRASLSQNGTPGLPASNPPTADLALNEVMAENRSTTNNAGTFPDWVELYNRGVAPVTLTGWSLSDGDDPRRFVFNNGPIVPAGGYLVVFFDAPTNAAPGIHTGFALDKEGSRVLLYDPDTNRIDAVSLGAQLPDYSIGRIAGAWQLTSPTPGGPNAAAATGSTADLVINEWLANTAPGGSDWVELYNRSTQPVTLNGIHLGSGAAIFRYTSLSFLPPGGFVQLLVDELPGLNHVDFKIPAAGGSIVLYSEAGVEVDRVIYGPQGEGISQGRLPDGGATIVAFPGSASPNAPNYTIAYGGPLLNEFLARNERGGLTPWGARADWLELANTNGAPLDLGSYGLSDEPGLPRWLVPPGTFIPANGYLRIWCDGDVPGSGATGPDLNTGFALGSRSGGVYLLSPSRLVVDYVEYGPQAADLSVGRSGGVWRALNSPTPGGPNSLPATLGNPSGLRFNEWQTASDSGNDWFELYNTGPLPVELSGLYLTDDPSLAGLTRFQVPPLSYIAGNGFAQFEADGDSGRGRDHVNFQLDGGGDALRLLDHSLALLDAVDFGDVPPGVSMGRLPDGSGNLVVFPFSPTPGESNHRRLDNVLINEVLAHGADPLEDAIELYNPGAAGVQIGGWFLSDNAASPKKFRIPAGTFLPSGGYLAFYQNRFNAGPDAFTLAATGGEVVLSEADNTGALTGAREVAKFGASLSGVSLGRVETCFGTEFVALNRHTFGQDAAASLAEFRTGAGMFNGDAKAGTVVINEVMYHPAGHGAGDDTLDEYIELLNVTGAPVPLFDPARPANTWRVGQGVGFKFPSGLTLPAGGFLLLVNFDPATDSSQLAAFRGLYGVSSDVPLLGPYSGKLDNAGETLELLQPDAPEADGFVPYVVADRVSYASSSPWPSNAAGAGASLQRRVSVDYGNDPANWSAAAPTAGQPNPPQPASAPAILSQPLSRTVLAGSRVVFSATVCGRRPLSYQWKRDGANLSDATNAALVLPAAQPGDAGSYSVEVRNSAGNILSAPATLAFGTLPVITGQPQPQAIGGGATAILQVQATGAGPLTYQWRRNGEPIPGATSASLVIENLRARDTGSYSVLVINPVGAVPSDEAVLTVLIPPSITSQPQHQSVAPGATATFSVSATGVGTLRYQWQFNATNLNDATSATLAIPNAQLGNEGDYRVIVGDDNIAAPSQTAHLTVRVPPVILVRPRSQTNIAGSTLTFSVVASGSVPMAFRWYRISTPIVTNILNTTNCTFTIPNAQPFTSGVYRVVLTNAGNMSGTIFSQFTVAVVAPPVITNQPVSQIVSPGADATFTAGVGGTGPFRYQWNFYGTELPGATNLSLTVTNVQVSNQGPYQLVVGNFAGTATSSVAILALVGASTLQVLERLPDGTVRLALSGMPDRGYAIEAAPDLEHWALLSTVTYTNGIMPFTDATATGASSRFYRARLVP